MKGAISIIGYSPFHILKYNVDTSLTQEDTLQLRQLFKDGTNYMVVWYAAPVGKKGTANFTYEIITKDNSKK